MDRAFLRGTKEDEKGPPLWQSQQGSLSTIFRPTASPLARHIPNAAANQAALTDADEMGIHSELAKLWIGPPNASDSSFDKSPLRNSHLHQRSKTLSADDLWFQPFTGEASGMVAKDSSSPVPNWGEIARQERPASTSSSHTTLSGFPGGHGGSIYNSNRHLRMATAPVTSSEENAFFNASRRHRTVSGPPAPIGSSSSHYIYQQPEEIFPPPSSYTDYLNANNTFDAGGASSNSNTLGNRHQSHTQYPLYDAPSVPFAHSGPRSPPAASFSGQSSSSKDNTFVGKPWSHHRRFSTSSAISHSHGTLPHSSATAYQLSPPPFASPYRSRHPSGGDVGGTPKQRPSFPSSPNRFVSRQLKQGSRDYQSSVDTAYVRRGSRPPIGLFVWGFPDAVRVKDIIAAFSSFGEMINVGIEIKSGIKYSFIDFESVYCIQDAYSKIPKERYLGMKDALQVRLRFDKSSKPSFDDGSLHSPSAPLSQSEAYVPEQQDKRTIHLYNLPHNINKPEIEQFLSQIAPISRIKIFQRAVEKKSSVFVTFKSVDKARSAAVFMKRNNLAFNEMKEPLVVEYPTQDISRNPPVFATDPNAVPTLSKKARKMLAASNTIAYARSPDAFDAEVLQSALSVHGPCTVYIIRADAPSTAFIKFQTPKACAEALAEKTCGVTLPRHKRVDVQQVLSEGQVRDYLLGVADIKAITYADNVTTIEFLTAIGAAQGIVRFQSVPFEGQEIVGADYSPSLQLVDEYGNEVRFASPVDSADMPSSNGHPRVSAVGAESSIDSAEDEGACNFDENL